MTQIISGFTAISIVFAYFATLALSIVIFALGRSWLLRVDGADGSMSGEKDSASKHWRPE